MKGISLEGASAALLAMFFPFSQFVSCWFLNFVLKCTNLAPSFLSQGFPSRLPPQYPGDSNVAPSSAVASVCIPSAVLSPPIPTDALAQPGYLTAVVQPYVEQNVLVPLGGVGGQVQVPQPTVSLAQQASAASSQQAALEVNAISVLGKCVNSTFQGMWVYVGETNPFHVGLQMGINEFKNDFFLQQNVMPVWGPCCHWLFCWEVSVPPRGKTC